MIYYLTALYSEAEYFIKRYRMKKLMDVKIFQMFKSENELLIISGTEPSDGSVSVCHLLTLFPPRHEDVFICVRLQHEWELYTEKGATLYNKITDMYSGKEFYPDMLARHPFDEGQTGDAYISLVYQAAVKFLPSHGIYIFDTGKITPIFVEALASWADERAGRRYSDSFEFSEKEEKIIETLCENLRLGSSMQTELKKSLKLYMVKNGDLCELWEDLKDLRAESKREGKEIYAEIIRKFDSGSLRE